MSPFPDSDCACGAQEHIMPQTGGLIGHEIIVAAQRLLDMSGACRRIGIAAQRIHAQRPVTLKVPPCGRSVAASGRRLCRRY